MCWELLPLVKVGPVPERPRIEENRIEWVR